MSLASQFIRQKERWVEDWILQKPQGPESMFVTVEPPRCVYEISSTTVMIFAAPTVHGICIRMSVSPPKLQRIPRHPLPAFHSAHWLPRSFQIYGLLDVDLEMRADGEFGKEIWAIAHISYLGQLAAHSETRVVVRG